MMMNDWVLIFGMAALTFFPRYIPFALAGKVKIPPLVSQALAFVPIAVLSVIIVQTSFVRDGVLALNFENHHMLAAIVAFIVALISRHQFLTIICGLVSFALMEWLFV